MTNLPELVPNVARDNYENGLNAVDRHQLIGWASLEQNAALEHAEDILLFQMASDYGLLAHWGDLGKLQFWITKSDLEKRNFNNVVMTLEGG